MKPKHLFIAGLSVVLVVAASCKKEDKEKSKTTAERIQAKWGVVNLKIHEHIDGAEDYDTTANGLPTDYFDIRSDNKIYASFNGEQDTLDYTLQNDSTLFIKSLGIIGSDGTYKIQNLTDNTLSLYTKETDPTAPSDYAELQINLKK